ncbi:MAG: hypothetical protein HY929_08935 [Euryarchaeota archaeon]|nr:hypothetical protein [Euryarchaeota archaeon]
MPKKPEKPKDGLAHGTWRLKTVKKGDEPILTFDFWVTEACRYIGETPRFDPVGKYAEFNIQLPVNILYFLEGLSKNEQIGDWSVSKVEDGFQEGKYVLDTKTYIISKAGEEIRLPSSLIEFLRDHDFYTKQYPKPPSIAKPKISLSEAIVKIKDLETKIKSIEEEQSRAQDLAKKLEEKIETLENERSKNLDNLRKKSSLISELEEKVSDLEAKLRTSESNSKQIEEERNKAQELAQELKERVKSLEGEEYRIKEIESEEAKELKKALNTITEIQEKTCLLEEELRTTKAEKSKLEEKLAKFKQLYGISF